MYGISEVDLRRYGRWYAAIREHIHREFGKDADLFIDLLAATSPRMQVRSNWRAAKRIYRQWKSGIPVDLTGVMRPHRPNIWRALRREPLKGEKVRRFAENLRGDSDVVTIDVFVCRALGVEQKSLTPSRYAELEQGLREAAYRHGVRPCEYQAALWQVQRQAEGRQPISFMAAVDDERQMTFWEIAA
jgi:hypothetical protein